MHEETLARPPRAYRRQDPTADAALRVVSRQEREAAARAWLLLSTASVGDARKEWQRTGIALLKCGVLFSAVRMEAELVHAAVGSAEVTKVSDFLEVMLFGGPVFVDQGSARYYALVPPSVPLRREWADKLDAPYAECLGSGTYVGVPDPSRNSPHGALVYWTVPMKGPGSLCDPGAVAEFVERGRHLLRHAKAGAS
ncbi:hypothetical protein ACFY7C_11825 [Streptomyces sp. NPDC012769]|uniref:hypothetical protein n=1 Tax=Streptomyces sp. NPDC012769 TaxID=3364848 RepID=UPI0036C3FD8B